MYRTLDKPEARDGLVIMPRDAAIILGAYRYRFLTTDQVQMLTGTTSRTKLNDRLRELWGADFLDRPELQRDMFAYADKRPTVHALGSRGATWLTDNHNVRFPKAVDWRAKNKNIKSGEFIRHTLGVTETMLTAERAINSVDGLRLIDRAEVWLTSPRYNERVLRPFELPTEIAWRDGPAVRRKTVPDYTFGIGDTRGETATRALHFLEYDRMTEDLVKSSATQSSILQKYLGYADAYARKIHHDLYGYNRFRVLFVIEGDQRRIDSMTAVYKAHVSSRIPAGAILYTTAETLKAEGFLAPIWQTAKGDVVSLVAPAQG